MLFLALGVWMTYFAISTISIGSFHPFFMGTYIAKIMIAWWLLVHYQNRIFYKYETAIYYLAVVSLIFYTWQIFSPGSLYTIMHKLDLSQGLFPNKNYASVIVYSVNEKFFLNEFPRNAGFAWEPGPFSCFLVLAIFFNLVRNRLELCGKKRLLVFLVALLSTQSTTGVLALLVLVVWFFWARYNNRYFRVFAIPISLALVFLTFLLVPILQQKIIEQSTQDVDKIVSMSRVYGQSYNPGRFASLQLGLRDFANYPLAGIGGNVSLRYGVQQGADVSTINGFATILSRYGSIGVLIFFCLIMLAGKWIGRHYGVPGSFIFPALILTISFGFSIIESPILVTLWFVAVFLKKPYKPRHVSYA